MKHTIIAGALMATQLTGAALAAEAKTFEK